MTRKGSSPRFIGIYSLPNLLTLSSIFLTLLAGYFAVQDNMPLTMLLLLSVGFIDSVDGFVARSVNEDKDQHTRDFGALLDNGVDLVNYSLGPVIVVIAAGFTSLVNYFIYFFYAASLVIRLAYFEVYGKQKRGSQEYFTGMPSTMSVLILPIVFALAGFVTSSMANFLIPAAFVVMGLLFIVNVQMPDLRTSNLRWVLAAVTLATVIFWLYRLITG
jgi:phosphatidylserine synthase